MNYGIQHRLLAMIEHDSRVRAELAATGELFDGYAPQMAQVHDQNAHELEKIVDSVGWPKRSVVGEEGSAAAWLILQHAIGQPSLLRRCLPLLRNAAEHGEAERQYVAFLEDRICFSERRPQIYGTQFDWNKSGNMEPWIIEDAENVNLRRQSVGLEPMDFSPIETDSEPQPVDYAQRQAEMLEWARSVGWI